MAVGMIVLYVVSLVVHQIVQPKLIGDSVGLDPFASLLFMFIGYRVGSVVGMILAIPDWYDPDQSVRGGRIRYTGLVRSGSRE